ncbi:hypothetical protein [Nocardioides sp.]|uniref:hypothetical protein n=1 Tax=Nocardioides sp. TaxID=35761 RepID=UPI00261203FC|nr:hypothetical protein [Nocardioides sp.]
MSSSLLRLIGAGLAAWVVVSTAVVPAHAHPFGPPQTVTISAASDGAAGFVRVRWSPGAVDDLALLWRHLREGSVSAAELADPSAISLSDSAAAARALRADPAFAAYLADHIDVTAAGHPCTSSLEPISSLPREGATLAFDCGTSVAEAEVRVSTLTDLHPAYRAFATGPGGAKAVYDGDHPVHRWSLDAAGSVPESAGRSALLQLSVTGVGLVAGSALLVGVRRRRTRKEARP